MNEMTSNHANVFNHELEINNAVLFARKITPDSSVVFIKENNGDKSGDVYSSVVFATLDRMKLQFSGEWAVELLPMNQVITLFTFIDYQAGNIDNYPKKRDNNYIKSLLIDTSRCFVSTVTDNYTSFLDMIIKNTITQNAVGVDQLFSFIRNMENFWVTHFLLSQLMNNDEQITSCKVHDVCKVYGVSESYFRRLCHNAFTCGPKKQLRLWRAAHSALQLIESNDSVATIAGNNGYASSSHFSSEMKSLFGITPKGFKNLEGLLHD